MTTKTTRIVSIVLTILPALVLLWGGLMKIIGREPAAVVAFLSKAGYSEYLVVVGLSSMVIAALLLYPKTNKIGFLLASCYFAAALGLEISGQQPPVSAGFIALLWIGMYLKNKQMFLN